jgi:S-adenosylmethionine synthetase
MVFGEITSSGTVDIESLVRSVIRDIGYDANSGFDYKNAQIIVAIQKQSPNIADRVNMSLDARESGVNPEKVDELLKVGAGDQGMMVGFACDETPELMPLPIAIAHRITRKLCGVRQDGTIDYLRPDGKSQVTIEYAYGLPKRLDTVVVAAQHELGIDPDKLKDDMYNHVILPAIPEELIDNETKFLINTSGSFVMGGPVADSGLTGRKILVDTYGGSARHGGGAFSGKDPTKVDRSGAYAARYVAKNLVSSGVARRLEVQISYTIGVATPVSVSVETFGTALIPDSEIISLVEKHFDLRPGAIIKDLDLRRPIYRQTASGGHFGRSGEDFSWEHTDKADEMRLEISYSHEDKSNT